MTTDVPSDSPAGSPAVAAPISFLPWKAFVVVSAAWLALVVLRGSAPPDLMDRDQGRPAMYALDIIRNGAWIVQRDASGDIASKPPLQPWLVALCCLPFDEINETLLYLPTALATLFVAWMVFAAGSRYFGTAAGLMAGLAYLMSPLIARQVWLNRSDAVFSLTVLGTALLGWRAWRTGRGWTWFWLAGGVSALAKGPLGLILAATGLLAAWWEKRSGHPHPIRGLRWSGLVLFAALPLTWLVLGLWTVGQPLIDKIFLDELLGKAVEGDKGQLPFLYFWQPFFNYFLTRYAPWSLFTVVALWRIARQPDPRDEVRRFERFVWFLFVGGLILFSLAAHHRADHLLPLIPAAALLAGRELARLAERGFRPMKRWTPQARLRALSTVALVFGLGVVFVHYHFVRAKDIKVRRTVGVKQLAADIRARVGRRFPLTFANTPAALQFYLKSMRPEVSLAQATTILKAPVPAFVAIEDVEDFAAAMGAAFDSLHIVARWPATGEPDVAIFSNHPRLEYTHPMRVLSGDLSIYMDGVHLDRPGRDRLGFRANSPRGELRVANEGERPRRLDLSLDNVHPGDVTALEGPAPQAPQAQHGSRCRMRGVLEPGKRWILQFGRERTTSDTLRVGMISDCRQAYWLRHWLGRNDVFDHLDFLVVNGDFVWERVWRYDLFLEQARHWDTVIFPVMGNHDRVEDSRFPAEAFQNRFGYRTRAFDYGPARFVLLDTGAERLDETQFAFLQESFAREPRPPQALVFCHVPPGKLKPSLDAQGRERDGENPGRRFIRQAARAGVDTIYAGHVNVFAVHDYATSHGTVRVVTTAGAGEKMHEADYEPHWLELTIAPGGIHEQSRPIPKPSWGANLVSNWRHRDAFRVRRFGGAALLFFSLAFIVAAAAHATLRVAHPGQGTMRSCVHSRPARPPARSS